MKFLADQDVYAVTVRFVRGFAQAALVIFWMGASAASGQGPAAGLVGAENTEGPRTKVLFGAIADQKLYGGWDGARTGVRNVLFIDQLRGAAQPTRVRLLLNDFLDIEPGDRMERMLRFRVRGRFLWYIAQGQPGNAIDPWFALNRLPLDRLPSTEQSPLQTIPPIGEVPLSAWGDIQLENLAANPGVVYDHGHGYETVARKVVPLHKVASPLVFQREGPYIYFDILPMADSHCLLFVIRQPSKADQATQTASRRPYLEVSEYRFAAERAALQLPPPIGPLSPGWRGVWKTIDTVDCTFNEPFWAVCHGHDYLFVTTSGNLYTTQKSGGRSATELLRAAEPNPIVALIQDAELTNVRAFTARSTFIVSPDINEQSFSLPVRQDVSTDAVFQITRSCADWIIKDAQ
jgi:hypothetical protein